MKLKHSRELRGSIIFVSVYFISSFAFLTVNVLILRRFELKTNIPTGSLVFTALVNFSRTQLPTCTIVLLAAHNRISNIHISLEKIHICDLKIHLRNFLKLHIKFNETICLINQCFIFRIALNAFEISFRWLILLFGIFAMLIWQQPAFGVPLATTGVLFSVADTTMLFIAVIFSCRLKNKINETEIIFKAKILSFSNNEQSFKRLQKSSLQFDHESSQISCGLFNFGWPALLSSVGTTISYLIILIQFEIAGLTQK